MKKVILLTRSAYLLSFLAIVLLVSGCNKDEEAPKPTQNVLEIISSTEGLDSLARLINDPSYQTLKNRFNSGEYTIFAPNNAAFRKLLQSIGLESMGEMDANLWFDIVLYHVVANATLDSQSLDSTATNLSTGLLNFSTGGDSIQINSNTQPNKTVIVTPNLQASNGMVHVINEIILPGRLQAIQPYFGTVAGLTSTIGLLGGVSTINSVFSSANLLTTLSSNNTFTVLAPINGAFNNFLGFTSQEHVNAIANYHILEGNVDFANAGRTINTLGGEPIYITNDNGTIYMNGIVSGDFGFVANNGRVVFLGGVLEPAQPLEDVITSAEAFSGATFTIFKTALEQTNITLGESKTILMPTDQAFKEAGLVTSIDSAARIDPAALTNILQTHVFEGIHFSSDIVVQETMQVNALNQTPLTITFTAGSNGGGSITVADANENTSDAQGISFDNLSDHGVVHVINKVLLP